MNPFLVRAASAFKAVKLVVQHPLSFYHGSRPSGFEFSGQGR